MAPLCTDLNSCLEMTLGVHFPPTVPNHLAPRHKGTGLEVQLRSEHAPGSSRSIYHNSKVSGHNTLALSQKQVRLCVESHVLWLLTIKNKKQILINRARRMISFLFRKWHFQMVVIWRNQSLQPKPVGEGAREECRLANPVWILLFFWILWYCQLLEYRMY